MCENWPIKEQINSIIWILLFQSFVIFPGWFYSRWFGVVWGCYYVRLNRSAERAVFWRKTRLSEPFRLCSTIMITITSIVTARIIPMAVSIHLICIFIHLQALFDCHKSIIPVLSESFLSKWWNNPFSITIQKSIKCNNSNSFQEYWR